LASTARGSIVVLAVILGCALSACTSTKPRATIGVSIQNERTSDFYKSVARGLRARAQQYNYRLIVRSANGDSDQQAQVEDFIAKGVDAIVLVPSDSETVGGSVLEANAAEIPVFTADIDSSSRDSSVISYVASDNYQGGFNAGRLICEAVPAHAEVAIVDRPEVTSVRQRVAGFETALKQLCAGVKVVADVDMGATPNESAAATKDVLKGDRDIAGIFFINDESLLNAAATIDSIDPRRRPAMVGYDGLPAVRDDISECRVFGDAAQEPERIGSSTIDAVHSYLTGARRVPRLIKIEVGTLEESKTCLTATASP
jgi:ribose transport system substrate-binding protein